MIIVKDGNKKSLLLTLEGEIYKIDLTKHSVKRGKERGIDISNIVKTIKKAASRIRTLNSQNQSIPFAIVNKNDNTAIIAKKENSTIHVVTVLKNKEFQIENVNRVIFL
ncbi:hypothetical protein SAMN04244560_00851 [Thermoanaerobacter thermohydrosulfuricus]|uniref:Uncharacterized protein n=1 Tax=Thermoanaerobacter thermohydrosulfuricus TaxID=1516 RepID=A0A1G7LR46_THETY|nr:hypothetical protein [Thermoanaerobacter thermohydrosulfuricus]SDF51861.1 hypothetical protein SAMN04244560_00851 [Thermoanaerobacter thermohydrosulfuricus]